MKFYLSLVLCLVLFFGTTACVENKYSECNKVIEITLSLANETKIFSTQSDNKDPQKALALADSFDQAVEKLKLLELQDKQLMKYQDGLAKMYSNLSQATRNFVAALGKKNLAEAKSAKQKLQEQAIPEQELLKGMRDYCQGNRL